MSGEIAERYVEFLQNSGEMSEFIVQLECCMPSSNPSTTSLLHALKNSWALLEHKVKERPPSQTYGAGARSNSPVALEGQPTENLEEVFPSKCSEFWAQISLDYSWEQLHSGAWQDVALFWRQAYSLSAVLKAFNLVLQGKHQEGLVVIDKAILMGAPILNNFLQSFGSELQKTILASNSGDTKKIGKVKFRNYSPENIPNKKLKLLTCEKEEEKEASLKDIPVVDMSRRIPTAHCPTLEDFYSHHMATSVPVVLTGVMDHWPAYAHSKWSLSYLKSTAGPRTVPVELGSKYTDHNWSQKLMTVSEFIDDYIVGGAGRPKAYLAQHQLFDQVPELREDICVPEYCYLKMEPCKSHSKKDGREEESEGGGGGKTVGEEEGMWVEEEGEESSARINCWFGPKGTVSPLHFDPDHNLLSQVKGRKYVRLYGEGETPCLYPHSGIMSNTSQVEVEGPYSSSFPLFEHAQYSEFVLHAGQMLYIPPKCWHYLRSLDTSFSVSFWWS